MNATQNRLGRGLDALLGTAGETDAVVGTGSTVDIAKIQRNPYQPRKRFDDDELKQLTDSVKQHGILQPLVVRDAGDHFQLIAGERRLRAAEAAGLPLVPVHIVRFNDQQVYEAALVENIQRTDLNPIEKAEGFKDYLERFKITHEELGKKLGIERATVSNLVGLLNLPADVQDAVRLGQINLGHAKVLKGLGDSAQASTLAKQVILQGLSVHALEVLIKDQRTAEAAASGAVVKDPVTKVEKTTHVLGIENAIRQRLTVRVDIRLRTKEKGQIVLGFDNNDDFERIVEILQK